jgi:sigma-54 dependent transcriptional regulator, acetoin dehydrogenase operon transcriptional activator AcoR
MSTAAKSKEMRPEIKRSWERSAMCGLDRGSELKLPYQPDLQAEERFLRAATPVLDHVGSFLEGSATTAVLTDARGRLLARKCSDKALTRVLDSTQSLPGFTWSEEYSGTTALSLAIEERMPAWVGAGEHYLEALRHLVCAAVPVIHPVSQRIQGVIDVTAGLKDASRHMLPVVLQAAHAIEERLYDDASAIERALLLRFMSASHRSGRPIVVLGERVELSTPPAARLLDVEDKTLLWEHASGIIEHHQNGQETFTLTDGRELAVTFERVEVDGRAVGVVIELDLARTAHTAKGREPALAAGPSPAVASIGSRRSTSPFLGRSSAARYLREQAEQLRTDLIPILIAGEAGSGKLTLAKAIAGEGSERFLFDAARTTVEAEAALLRQVATVVEGAGGTVIVRRIGSLSAQARQALAEIAQSAEATGSRVIATVTITPDTDEPATPVADAFGLRLDVPALRQHVDDLVDLIPYLIERRGATAHMAPAAIQTLMRYDWPGNVRELDGLIRALLTRKRTTDIVLADLPPAYQRGSRRLRRIEHVERAAIVQALLEVGGNKTRAAELLEIGRATLYRKIRAYGLDLEVSTR